MDLVPGGAKAEAVVIVLVFVAMALAPAVAGEWLLEDLSEHDASTSSEQNGSPLSVVW